MKLKGRTTFIISFLAPAVLLYGLFVVWPMLQSLVLSMFRWRGVSVHRTFVGSDNFVKLYHDHNFWNSLTHNLIILVVTATFILGISMTIAHILQGESRSIRAIRGIYLIPQVLSMVVIALLWRFIYNPSFGILKSIFEAVGLQSLADTTILSDKFYALPAVMVVIVWHGLGFYIMLLSAGIKNIPREVTESAMLDGARYFTMFRKITLPLLRPMMRICVIYLIIGSLNTFALVYVMNDGKRNVKTDVMLTHLYETAFGQGNYGLATAVAVVNFVLVMILSASVMRFFRKDPTKGATA